MIFKYIQREKDFNQCKKLIMENSKTFYKAFSMLKNSLDRKAIYAVYAYCRVVDDSIDEYKDLNLLKSYEDKLKNYQTSGITDDYIFRSLDVVFKNYYPKDYQFEPYYDLIEGQRQDYQFKQPETMDDLLKYCYLVAGVVGEMLSYILSPKENHHEVKVVAKELGEAMQITNILRDIGEDLKRGRIYVPKDLMKKHGVSEIDLKDGVINPNFINLFEELAVFATTQYDKALSKINLFKEDARIPLAAASYLYREIIETIRKNDYQVFLKRQVVSKERKEEIVKNIYFRS